MLKRLDFGKNVLVNEANGILHYNFRYKTLESDIYNDLRKYDEPGLVEVYKDLIRDDSIPEWRREAVSNAVRLFLYEKERKTLRSIKPRYY